MNLVMKLSTLMLATAVTLGLGSANTFAETVAAQKIASTQRLLPLVKITVGPDDQYHGAMEPDGQHLVFTHKSDLVSHLRMQNLKTGDIVDLLPLIADSQEPVFNPDGVLAFTFYKFSARGDICYKPLKSDKLTCLDAGAAGNENERLNPFWRGPYQIGYVVRDIQTQNARVVAEDYRTGEKEVLAEGRIWSPAMQTGGQYLFYSELRDDAGESRRVLVMKDLHTSKTKVLNFALPGISAFPAVSDDGQFLYFSHYLNDTNGDNVIDGNDNAVIFRVPLATLVRAKPGESLFPEQLTSVETSCSFPRPFQGDLYVTCDFEGALDVYRLPASGIIPPQWTEANLLNAFDTSRSYQERVLILNTLKYRFKDSSKEIGVHTEERLLDDHLLSDDTSAAQFYVRELAQLETGRKRLLLPALEIYLKARQLKKSQPTGEVTREFQGRILKLDQELARTAGGVPRFQALIRGILKSYVAEPKAAIELYNKVHFESKPDSVTDPLELYLYFELSRAIYEGSPKSRSSLMSSAYRVMTGAPELSEEAHIYYAFEYLKWQQEIQTRTDDRIKTITKFLDDARPMPVSVISLLNSEIATLKIIVSPDKASKAAAYRVLDQAMSKTRDDYFLRKALYIRAILNFTDAAEFYYLSLVATNWLRYTQRSDTEFVYARAVYSNSSLDQAYDSLGGPGKKKNATYASSFFYGSLSLTDDLESHAGYIRSMVLQGQRATIDQRYKNLLKDHQVEDNYLFVQALLRLIDSEQKAAQDPTMVSHLDYAIEQLQKMQGDRDSPVRYLLLGYCYLDKLLREAKGFDFDEELFLNAHRNLMLAYDLGRENERIQASALMDLGILHQRVQNYGLAARFFELRRKLGSGSFVSEDELVSYEWLYANALFYIHQPSKAADRIAVALKQPSYVNSVPLQERRAFYLEASGKYREAVEIYATLLPSGKIQGDLNLAKAYLNYGHGLFKLKRESEARHAFALSLEHANLLHIIPKGKERKIDFNPLRIQLVCYGFLAQIGTEPERLSALQKRGALLVQAADLSAPGILDDMNPTIIRNLLQQAELLAPTQPDEAANRLGEALVYAKKFGDVSQYLGSAIFHAEKDYMIFAALHPELSRPADTKLLSKLVDKTLHAYDAQTPIQPQIAYQKSKIESLWSDFSKRN